MKDHAIYGQEPTKLKLTDRAQRIFDASSPLNIEEWYDGNGNVLGYHFTGIINTLCLEPWEVSEILEMLGE